ncbi:MAG: LysM peptidoglycan-binding domain-containing protein [Acidobacteria bacterium]|nr:LysM peptidoglycan-binding domain-containing protein [Acidobacteriota bacterium]
MTIRTFIYIALLSMFLSCGCGANKTRIAQPRPDSFPGAQNPETAGPDREAAVAEKNQASEQFPQPASDGPMEGARGIAAGPDAIGRGAPETAGAPDAPIEASLPEAIRVQTAAAPAEEADISKSREASGAGQTLLDSALDLISASQEHWAAEDQDRALAALDEAYALVASVNTEADPALIRQKDDLRYMISRRILEIYASRYRSTTGNHKEIPLTLNEYVEKEIKRFQVSARRSFIESHKRSGSYMPMILKALQENGMPEELAWLPLIESGFRVNALSSARALGMWQFIASTGQKFGLKRDNWIDERMDPEKSTLAAVAYLKELHQIFGDWTTVLAAYNCGEGAVLRKIRNQKISYLDNFWDLFQTLPYETASYVPRFLATLHILKDPARYGFELEPPDSPVDYETVVIEKPVRLSAVAEAIGVRKEELAALNPELRHESTPPRSYPLRVPAGKTDTLLARIDGIPDWSPPTYATHTVRKGESLSVIAKKYGTTVSRIALTNNIRTTDIIRVNQKLKVPLTGAAGVPASSGSRGELEAGGSYRVQKGDTLWQIAKKFNTSTKSIQQINGLTGTLLSVGQVLLIPQ